MTPDPLLQLGRKGLYPTEQDGVIDRYTTIGQHGREVAIADRKGKIPPQRLEDHLGLEMPPLEEAVLSRSHHAHRLCPALRLQTCSACRCNRTGRTVHQPRPLPVPRTAMTYGADAPA